MFELNWLKASGEMLIGQFLCMHHQIPNAVSARLYALKRKETIKVLDINKDNNEDKFTVPTARVYVWAFEVDNLSKDTMQERAAALLQYHHNTYFEAESPVLIDWFLLKRHQLFARAVNNGPSLIPDIDQRVEALSGIVNKSVLLESTFTSMFSRGLYSYSIKGGTAVAGFIRSAIDHPVTIIVIGKVKNGSVAFFQVQEEILPGNKMAEVETKIIPYLSNFIYYDIHDSSPDQPPLLSRRGLYDVCNLFVHDTLPGGIDVAVPVHPMGLTCVDNLRSYGVKLDIGPKIPNSVDAALDRMLRQQYGVSVKLEFNYAELKTLSYSND